MQISLDKTIEIASTAIEDDYKITTSYKKDKVEILVLDIYDGECTAVVVGYSSCSQLEWDRGVWNGENYIFAWACEAEITQEESRDTKITKDDPRWDAFWDIIAMREAL